MITRAFVPPSGLARWPHVSAWTVDLWRHWCLQLPEWDEARFDQYWIDRFAYGLGVASNKRGAATNWLYLPTPRAVEFHSCRAINVLFGGARGGAKSHTLRWDIHKRCLAVQNYRAILFRRTFTELRDNHIDKLRLEIQGGLPAEYKESDKLLVYHGTGATLRLAHCENVGDEDKYLSSEYDDVNLDELATFTRQQAVGIMGSARSVKPGITAMFRSSSNPGGAHTLWCADWFMDHHVTPEDDPYYDPADWAFVPSLLYDNPWLMDPDGTFKTYEKRLGPLSPERRRQLLEGDWSAVGGQFFPEFSRTSHVANLDSLITPETSWERCLDWGYNAKGYCAWIACLPDGRFYVREEYPFTQTIAHEVAQEIGRRSKHLAQQFGGDALHVRKTTADPSMWNHTGHTGESLSETFSRGGVWLQRGDNQRELGWQRLRHFFAKAPDGLPWLVFHPSCTYALRSIPSLVSDKAKPDDVDTTGDDHAGDAIRYFCMSRPAPSSIAPKPPAPKGTMGWLMAQLHKKGGFLGRDNIAGAA